VNIINEQYINHNFIVNRSKSKYLYLNNNKKLIDFCMGSGTLIFGHSPKFLTKRVTKQVKRGTIYVAPNKYAIKSAELLKDTLSNVKNVVFSNSGSEATMRALRIARSVTKKDKIIYFEGFWHGTHDQVLFDSKKSEINTLRVTHSEGISKNFSKHNVIFNKNDKTIYNYLKLNNNIAAVIIEPIQGSNPSDNTIEHIKNIISTAKKNNIIVILDEIITGFRLSYGGANKKYNLNADIVCYGKSISHGFSIGITAINKKTSKLMKNKKIVFGGTFSANPLVSNAMYYSLKKYSKEKNSLYTHIDSLGDIFRANLNSFFANNNIDMNIIGVGSISRIIFSKEVINSKRERDKYESDTLDVQAKFYNYLYEKGYYISLNRIIIFSYCHSNEDILKFINYIKKASKL